MNFQDSCNLLEAAEIQLYPFPHLVVDNFLSPHNLNDLRHSLQHLMLTVEPRAFQSAHGTKKEWKVDEKNNEPEYSTFKEFMGFLSSKGCAEAISTAFNLDFDLVGDPSFDGGGFVVSPPGSFLGYHADFNYSSEVQKYRVANILLYMNEKYSASDGGNLHLLDPDTLTVEKAVAPIENRALVFLTTDKTPHGVSRNLQEFSRKSFNAYFYTDQNPKDTDNNPHKTLWINS
jgi:Rps23 Pro-64 3,4-dihydroxylase Tpa1-like proline 4-hydroxylase